MPPVFSVVWFAAALGGAVAVVVGLSTRRERRRASLVTAAVCFWVAGVLGILSIGVVFIALSVGCFAGAARADGERATGSSGA